MQLKKINKEIKGVFEIKNSKFRDNRGTFLNLLSKEYPLFKSIWGDRDIQQINISNTKHIGTVRGMHFQSEPYGEAKLISCIKGKVWDVALDLRENSETYLRWHAVELDSNRNNSILIPEKCAHGFQTLEKDCELIYIHSENWVKESELGLRWNDPTIKISWPLEIKNISNRDQNLPLYKK